jgi:hypothetical protein
MVANVDVELYDTDNYDAIRTYNRTMKQVETEQQFWNSNRNTNSRNTSALIQGNGTENNVEIEAKVYRGPDLMRGGRTPGGRGGGGRGSIKKGEETAKPTKNDTADASKPNLRHKARVLDKRRDQQKKAQTKRTGA